MKLYALVVTFNRKDSLKLCLERLLKQRRRPDHILVINNNSTDGTGKLLESYANDCTIINMEKNIGGAGAYHVGLKWCVQQGAGWIWCVEDDIIAPRDFAAKAVDWIEKFAGQDTGFIYPSVLSVYNRHDNDVKMNMSGYGATQQGVLEIRQALFSGLLVNASAIREVGLPIKEFFIYHDDWEFTTRMSRAGWKGYWLKDIFVWHNDKPRPKITSYINGRHEEMWKYYFGIRNELSVIRREQPLAYAKLLLKHTLLVPIKIILRRPQHKFSVAFNWGKWALKSLSFKFRIERA